MSIGDKWPQCVYAVENPGTHLVRYHAFLKVGMRDAWVDEAPQARSAVAFHNPGLRAAKASLFLVLHHDERKRFRLS